MKRLALVLLLAGLAAGQLGCIGRAINEGYGAVAGAKANFVPIQALPVAEGLGPVTIEPITSEMGVAMSPDWLSALAQQARLATSAKPVFVNGKRPIKITGRVVHYETPEVLDELLGPAPEVVVRLTAHDAGTGQVIGVGNVLGRARSSTSSSQEDLTEAFGKGVVKWLETSIPPPPEDKKD